MAKYVCDFEQVTAIGEKLCSTASETEVSISDYSSKISNDLISWNGEAKENFIAQCDWQVNYSKEIVKKSLELGEFIKSSAKSIEDLEAQLASLSI